jgi:hypothetical protein
MQMPAINFPAGKKVFGGNIRYGPEQPAGAWWDYFWSTFPWTTVIRPQIDMLRAMGGNTLRMLGGAFGVSGVGRPEAMTITAPYSQASYIAKQVQVADYLVKHGMHYYLTEHLPGVSQTLSQDAYTTLLAAEVQALQPYWNNIIGFDILQEGGFAGFDSTMIGTMLDGVKAKVAALGLSPPFGYTVSDNESVSFAPGFASYAAHIDYADFHIYTNSGAPFVESNCDPWLFFYYGGFDFIWGEYGDPNDGYDFYYGPTYVAQHPVHSTVRGGLYWCIVDANNTDYGVLNTDYSADMVKLTRLLSATGTAPGPAKPLEAGFQLGDRAVWASPYGSTNDYAGAKMYRNGVQQGGTLQLPRLVDNAYWATHQATYQGAVVTGTGATSPLSDGVVLPGRLPAASLKSRCYKTFR